VHQNFTPVRLKTLFIVAIIMSLIQTANNTVNTVQTVDLPVFGALLQRELQQADLPFTVKPA